MDSVPPLHAADVTAEHDRLLADTRWPGTEEPPAQQTLWHWIRANHRFNTLLWREEDLARRTRVADAEIAANKRAIDRHNQACTDAPVATPAPGARLNSETAGSMVDRLSIMALKVHAMQAQTQRTDADAAHRASSHRKLVQLRQQRGDLAACLDTLIADARAGRAYFKVYRQFKMYNDARFNPVLAAEAADPGRTKLP